MVFTTHNMGILKTAARIKQQSEQKLKPMDRIMLDEADGIAGEMKDAMIPGAQAGKVEAKTIVEAKVITKGAKHGGKKKSK